jgi:hypothetical protein
MIFNALSVFLIVITTLWLVSLLYFFFSEDSHNQEFGLFILIMGALFIGLFGWGVAGHTRHALEFTQESMAVVVKTPTSLILTIKDNPIGTITSIADYNKYSTNSTVKVYQEGWGDIYGNTNWLAGYKVKE